MVNGITVFCVNWLLLRYLMWCSWRLYSGWGIIGYTFLIPAFQKKDQRNARLSEIIQQELGAVILFSRECCFTSISTISCKPKSKRSFLASQRKCSWCEVPVSQMLSDPLLLPSPQPSDLVAWLWRLRAAQREWYSAGRAFLPPDLTFQAWLLSLSFPPVLGLRCALGQPPE